jgi:hypothetical protein
MYLELDIQVSVVECHPVGTAGFRCVLSDRLACITNLPRLPVMLSPFAIVLFFD